MASSPWIDCLARELGGVVLRPSVRNVHELRIAIRRVQAWMGLLSSPAPEEFTHALGRLMPVLGKIRDLDVMSRHELSVWIDLPPREGLEQKLTRRLQRHLPALNLSGVEFEEASLSGALPAIEKLVESFFDRGYKAASEGATLAEIHQFRLAVKRLRYSFDALELPDRSEALVPVQKVLGQLNDLRQLRRAIARRYRDTEAGQSLEAQLEERKQAFVLCWQTEIAPRERELRQQWLSEPSASE